MYLSIQLHSCKSVSKLTYLHHFHDVVRQKQQHIVYICQSYTQNTVGLGFPGHGKHFCHD